MTTKRRKEYDKIYMNMAEELSKLSYAVRNKVGCLIVSKEGQIISQGYNGTPTGFPNECEDVECSCRWTQGCCKCAKPIDEVKSVHYCHDCNYAKLITKDMVLHAESNAISKCAKWISSTEGATLYVTLSPCPDCAKLIIQAGISRVVYRYRYRITTGIDILLEAGITVEQI